MRGCDIVSLWLFECRLFVKQRRVDMGGEAEMNTYTAPKVLADLKLEALTPALI